MSCHVDNIVICTQIEHILSATSLYEIHLCIFILSLFHVHSFAMEDNPLLVDMCLVVMLIACMNPRHISCLYMQGTSMMYSYNYLISIIILIIFIFLLLFIEVLDIGIKLLSQENSYMVSELYKIHKCYLSHRSFIAQPLESFILLQFRGP